MPPFPSLFSIMFKHYLYIICTLFKHFVNLHYKPMKTMFDVTGTDVPTLPKAIRAGKNLPLREVRTIAYAIKHKRIDKLCEKLGEKSSLKLAASLERFARWYINRARYIREEVAILNSKKVTDEK